MTDPSRTNQELIAENAELKHKIQKLEQLESERRQMKEALIENEHWLRTIVAGTQALLVSVDINGHFTYANDATARVVGCASAEELIGKSYLHFIHPEDRQRVLETFINQVNERQTSCMQEFRITDKEGQVKWFSFLSTLAIKDGQVVGQTGVAQDITDRKQAEDALRKNEEKYRTILANIEDGYFEVTLTGSLTLFNHSLCQIWGYPENELLGMNYRQYTDAENAKKLFRTFRKVFKTGESAKAFDWQIISRDGTNKFIETSVSLLKDSDDKPQGFNGIVRDITDRKQVETVNARLLLRQRAILDNLPMMAWLKDTESRLEMINEPYAKACGHTIYECIGKTDLDLFPEEMARGYMADDREVCLSNQKKLVEECISTPDGMRWVLTYKTPIYNEHGGVIGTAGIAQDITEQKQAEEEKARLQDQLTQAQKMESVGQLAGGVAHDFNNMLGVILGHAEMALDLVDPAEPLHADLEEIREAALRSADITRQLLTFARKQTIVPKVLDLNKTIEGMLKMSRRLIGEDIELVWMPGSDLWTVKVDPSQIDQILVNLFVNARDAINGVGKIIVETGKGTFGDAYRAALPGFIPGECVWISVRDTGCGMDKLMLEHIFEPFFTTKGVGEGTGLGLSMVYGAVKQNDGYVDVSSEPGQGTVFTIYLPRFVAAGATAWISDRREIAPAEGGRETILLVEDEPAILQMTTRMLQRLGYSVLAADTPGEALRLAGDFAGETHLLMTDVIMPEMNGRVLADRLMTIKKGMKCLFMSGYTSDIIANHGVLVNGMHFIQKPFSQKDLATRVREVLNTEETMQSNTSLRII